MSRFISTTDAAAEAQVDTSTIRRWCQQLKIGIKVGGRWRISVSKLQLVLDGIPNESPTEKEYKSGTDTIDNGGANQEGSLPGSPT